MYLLRSVFPSFPHLIMISASLSPVSQTKLTKENGNENKHSTRMAIELRPAVSVSFSKILEFHALTNSLHKFHEARIENWLPVDSNWGPPDRELAVIKTDWETAEWESPYWEAAIQLIMEGGV